MRWVRISDNRIGIRLKNVKLNNKYNLINENGKLLSNTWFDCVYEFVDGYALVNLNDKWNFVKTDGTYLSDIWFDDTNYFYGDLAEVKIKNAWYKLDKRGNLHFTVRN